MNFQEIADAATGMTPDAAFAAMSAETVSKEKPIDQRMVNERTVFALIGSTSGENLMTAIEAAQTISARVKAWFKPSEAGIDILDASAQAILAGMVASSVITQAESDALTAYGSTQELKYPGLKVGHIISAQRMRAAGEI